MGAEKILRNTGLLAATGVLALALAAVPVAPGLDAGFASLKTAQAKGNENGGGNGNSGNAGNGGASASAGAGGQGSGGISTEGSHEFANAKGMTASSLKGLNAGHASINAFANASDDSMVGAIRTAILGAFTDEAEDPEDGLISTDNPDEVPVVTLVLDPIIDDEDIAAALKYLVDDKIEGGP